VRFVVRCVAAPDVCLVAQPRNHVRVVQVERRPFRTNSGQLGEIVTQGETGGPPQRVALTPRIVDRDGFAEAVTFEVVPQEYLVKTAARTSRGEVRNKRALRTSG
jgi:hypothetical protein